MLALEDGPFKAFHHLRRAVGVEHDPEGRPYSWPTWFPANLLECTWCLSVWVAGILLAVWLLIPLGNLGVTMLAVAALAAILESAVNRTR